MSRATTGFQQYGIQPGPLLFTTQAELVWGLIASLYISSSNAISWFTYSPPESE